MGVLISASSVAFAETTVIIDTDMDTNGDRTSQINGTQSALTTNLPGGSWIEGAGYRDPSWWRGDTHDFFLCTDDFGLALPTHSDSYAPPESLTLEVDILSYGAGGIGFWDVMPSRSTDVQHFNVDVGFAGLIYKTDKCIYLYYGGRRQTDKIDVSAYLASGTDYHRLSLTVNTTSGDVTEVRVDGRVVPDVTAKGVFTVTATAYAGMISAISGGANQFRSFRLSSESDVVPAPVQTVSSHKVSVLKGEDAVLSVTSYNSVTKEPIPVEVVSSEVEDYTFEDGVFTWTSDQSGTFKVTFASSVGDLTATDEVFIKVYGPAVPRPESAKPIYKAAVDTAPNNCVCFAGTGLMASTDRTSFGLNVNVPNGQWHWFSGFRDMYPWVWSNETLFNLRNERCGVALPLKAGFDCPRYLYVEMELVDLNGKVMFGFFNPMPEVWLVRADSPADTPIPDSPATILTGLNIEVNESRGERYAAGAKQGETFEIACDRTAASHVISFFVDTRTRGIFNVGWDGYALDGVEIPEAVGDTCAWIGLGTDYNCGSGNSLMKFKRFEVYDVTQKGLKVLIR